MSIWLVILFHANWQKPFPGFNFGLLGVRVFFVISGFLITKLLLEERTRTGRISISQFYLRRAFRILPAAYVYIAIGIVLVPYGMHLVYRDVPSVLFYYADYHLHSGAAGMALGQFWSLSVEEQFYLLWPALLVLLGARRAPYACVALFLTAPAFRLLSAFGVWPSPANFAFECVCDALATGCILALWRDRLWANRVYRAMVKSPALGVVALLGFVLTCTALPLSVQYVVGIPILNFSIAGLLDRYMRMPETTVVGRVLNARPVAWIGMISYSLYVWQQPWMFTTWPIVIRFSGAFACAAISFYFVERPMLRLRNRLVRTRSTPSVARQLLEGS